VHRKTGQKLYCWSLGVYLEDNPRRALGLDRFWNKPGHEHRARPAPGRTAELGRNSIIGGPDQVCDGLSQKGGNPGEEHPGKPSLLGKQTVSRGAKIIAILKNDDELDRHSTISSFDIAPVGGRRGRCDVQVGVTRSVHLELGSRLRFLCRSLFTIAFLRGPAFSPITTQQI
jgi:hypothetical protein